MQEAQEQKQRREKIHIANFSFCEADGGANAEASKDEGADPEEEAETAADIGETVMPVAASKSGLQLKKKSEKCH